MVHCNFCVPSYNSFRNVINLHCYRIPKDPKLPGTVYMSFLIYNNRKSFFKRWLDAIRCGFVVPPNDRTITLAI